MAEAILTAFPLLPVLLLAVAAVLRLRLWLRSLVPRHPVDPQSIPMEELALLADGPDRMVYACLVGLYDSGHITTCRDGLLAQSPPPPGAHPLSRTVYDLIASDGPTTARRLRLRVRGRLGQPDLPAIKETRGRLAAAGLLPTTGTVRTLRCLHAVAFLGSAATLATSAAIAVLALSASSPDVTMLFPVGWSVALWFVALYGTRVPYQSRTGRKAVRDAAALVRRQDLARVPGQRAVAVAVYGPVVLWRAKPLIAAGLGLPRRHRTRSLVRSKSTWVGGLSGWSPSGSYSDCYSGLEPGDGRGDGFGGGFGFSGSFGGGD